MSLYSLGQYDMEILVSHPPLWLVNLTTSCNIMNFHLLKRLADFFHGYKCKRLIPTEAGEKRNGKNTSEE